MIPKSGYRISGSCSSKKIERDDDSKKSHPALARSRMNRKTQIAVVGAGLGGLTVAGFLQRAGFAVTIYEQAPTFSRIGAGIILSANAMKVLRRLGVEDELIRTGIKPRCFVRRAWDTRATMYEIY